MNRPDGRVEVVAEGPPESLQKLLHWCRIGAAMGRVDSVDVTDEPATGEWTDFSVRL
jgi:acylphosphatase